MSKKNKKYLIIAGSICLIVLLIYASYVHWTNYVLKKDTIASLEWAVPLSEDYSYDNEIIKYSNNRGKKLEEQLKEFDLKLVVVENKEEEDSYYKNLYGVKNNLGETIIPAIHIDLNIDSEQKYILAEYYSPENKDTDKNKQNSSNGIFPYDTSSHGTYKHHYYNLDGTDFIEGDFEAASLFKNGYACVEKNREHRVISTKGEELLKVKCDDLRSFNSDKGLFEFSNENEAVYKNGNHTLHDCTPRSGIIDISGKIILEPKYSSISYNRSNNADKILVEEKNNKGKDECVFLDNNFNPISGKIYEWVNPFYEEITTVKYKGKWYIINEDEEVIAKIGDCEKVDYFSEGIAMVECNKELKYIDTTGKVFFSVPKIDKEYVWSVCLEVSEGKVGFETKNKKFGYMDTKGNVVVAPIFDHAHSVYNGEAYVEIGDKAGVIKF